MAALPLPGLISQESSKNTKFRTIMTQFGDGYSQRAPDGINSSVDEWSIVWASLDATDKNTIVSALEAVGGWDILTWTPNGEAVEKKFIVNEGFSMDILSGGVFNIQTKLVQVFDL